MLLPDAKFAALENLIHFYNAQNMDMVYSNYLVTDLNEIEQEPPRKRYCLLAYDDTNGTISDLKIVLPKM